MSVTKKILFVDDEESIVEIVSEYFQAKGYEVVTARSGLEAVKVLENEKIDCCFTDINMPGMDGLELAEYIRVNDNTIPVIIVTGYPSLYNTIRTLKNGVVDFLIKPIDLNRMEVCVRRVLRERQLFVENIILKKEVQNKASLENVNQELLYKVQELHTLNRIMSDFTSLRSSGAVFQRLVEITLSLTSADESKFYVINEGVNRPFEVAVSRKKPRKQSEQPSAHRQIHSSVHGEISDEVRDEIRIPEEALLMEVVADEIPCLISDTRGGKRLPEEIRSCIVVPLKIRGKIFGVLTASVLDGDKRFDGKDLYYLSFMTNKAAYAIENMALYENIYENLFSTLYAFVKALEARDAYTQKHSRRVTDVAMLIAKAMGRNKDELDVLNVSARLHDIGKIGIRDSILLKPGKLTPVEFNKIKEHPDIGADIVGQLGLWETEQQIIRCHHERFDGRGYPKGLKGEEIPILSRILSVADSFDAMTSDRSYRKKLSEATVIQNIKQGAGTQFDPEVVKAFLQVLETEDFLTRVSLVSVPMSVALNKR